MAAAREVLVTLDGHLTREVLAARLAAAFTAIVASPEPPAVLVDCRGMSGYDIDARSEFVDWNRKVKDRIVAVAVLTENRLWHVVVASMGLASGQTMKAFLDDRSARAWVTEVVMPRAAARSTR
ncbi:MAG: hypothetical protein IT375_21990 [Polyangiaceae bacterium]|nr:hypothetical protein [Polyangiaceae bacterium]